MAFCVSSFISLSPSDSFSLSVASEASNIFFLKEKKFFIDVVSPLNPSVCFSKDFVVFSISTRAASSPVTYSINAPAASVIPFAINPIAELNPPEIKFPITFPIVEPSALNLNWNDCNAFPQELND